MIQYIPKAVLVLAKEFSKFKTPPIRTAGFQEQEGQIRGNGDILDTVGTLMLTHHLASSNIPVKMQLALWQGDDYDLEANGISINLKTSAWQPSSDDFSQINYHMAIKESEFNKLTDIFVQTMVHLNPPSGTPHVHFCGWMKTKQLSYPLVKNQYYKELPNTGGSMGLWIPACDLNPFSELESYLRA